MKRLCADVAVVGAGPAGCVFAARMAALGFDVCLIERARFPRAHLGESLSPGVVPMLAGAGLAHAVERAGYRRVYQVRSSWEGPEIVRQDVRGQGLLVDRGAFDAALLAAAVARGVRLLQPALARVRARGEDGWQLHVDTAGETVELACDFLADASGRAARLGGARRATGPRTLALHGYWTGRRLPDQPRIEAGDGAWYWGVPLPDGSYNTLVFIDAERVRDRQSSLESLEDRLRAWLRPSKLLDGARDATLRGAVRAADATPYLYEDCVGPRHVRIGDAALALDPLSSSGVQKAVQTALAAAIVANTLLRRPQDAAAARRYYGDSLADASARHRGWARGHYAAARRHDPFWTARAATTAEAATAAPIVPPPPGDDVSLRVSVDCRWEELPCLGPEYVESRTALRHPGVDGPVAFLGGQELAPLLRAVRPGMTQHQLAGAWSGALPFATALSIARWLAARGVLERDHGASAPAA